MPCQHLAQIQQLQLPISNSDVLKVICPVCGNVDVCAYTPMNTNEEDESSAPDISHPKGAKLASSELASQPRPPR